jgi:hypothetical protein
VLVPEIEEIVNELVLGILHSGIRARSPMQRGRALH